MLRSPFYANARLHPILSLRSERPGGVISLNPEEHSKDCAAEFAMKIQMEVAGTALLRTAISTTSHGIACSNHDFCALKRTLGGFMMKKFLTAAALTAMAAGYAAADPGPLSASCHFYPGCKLGQTSSGTSSSSGSSSGSSDSQAGLQQNMSSPASTVPQSKSDTSGNSDPTPYGSSSLKAQQSPYWAGCYFYPGC